MLTKEKIDKFYIDVKALGLKFPVAEIARETGYSKGNVSGYLKGKEPSENFLKAFYEKFGKSFINVPREQDEPLMTVANEDQVEYRPEKKIDPLAVINELILQQKTLISNNERLTKTNEDLSQTAIVSLAEILKAFSPSPAKDKKKRHAFDQRKSLPIEPVDRQETHLSEKKGNKKGSVSGSDN